MHIRATSVVIITAGAWVLGAAHGWAGQEANEHDDTVTATTFDQWMSELSNWGRSGADDELGTINLITPAKRVQAAGLVADGIIVSLSRQLQLGTNATFQRGFDNIFAYGGPGLGNRVEWIEEQHRIGCHGRR
ncbi:MAG: hypothetical protein VYE68_16845 [Acidobacteriota bacterium]|nr:hypothetical protein [Acidobacteriota bacterium]